jgi:RNA polymerase sigma-70 factor (ECF subfamily)
MTEGGSKEAEMASGDLSTALLAEHRRHVVDVAYRILGDRSAAEDVVQDAWLQLHNRDLSDVRNPRGYLTTVVSRLALDELRSARMRRERYVGPWLPEPVVTEHAPDPADRVTLDESVSLALLAVLERLSPAERTSLVLHDVFGMSFDEIATVVGRTHAACRQLAARARRHVRAAAPRYTADRAGHDQAVRAFAAAMENGDLERLVAVLDQDVVWRADGGGKAPANRRVLVGAEIVARLVVGLKRTRYRDRRLEPAVVNAGLGLVSRKDGHVVAVYGFTVAAGRITEIDIVTNPDKLGRAR